MFKFIEIEKNIKLFKFSGNNLNSDLIEYQKIITSYFNEKNLFIIFDIKEMNEFNLNFIKSQISYIYNNIDKLNKCLCGVGILINKEHKFIIKIILKLYSKLPPHKVSNNLEEIIEFCNKIKKKTK